jgi:hypothetical protein
VRRLAAVALLLATPLLIAAASDRRGDVAACMGGAPVHDPAADVVSVDAVGVELGTSAEWRVTFAERVPVPDLDGAPLRIDVLVRDPELPARSRGDEHGMNRIVRWDATGADAPIDIVWLGGEGHTPFNPPVISDRTVQIQVPGRILLGEAQNGTESVRRARWSILVRDGDACDRVGDVPVFRMRMPPSSTPPPPTRFTTDPPTPAAPSWTTPVIIAFVLVGAAVIVGMVARRRSR